MTLRWLLLASIAVVPAACSEPSIEPDVPQPGSISIFADTLRLHSLADSAPLFARVRSTDGVDLPAAQIRWTSSNESVARISASGYLKPIAEGQSLVIAMTDSLIADTVIVRVSLPGSYKAITTGHNISCALGNSGRAFCWGSDQFGSLGFNASQNVAPGTAVDAPVLFKAISAGKDHVCALDTSGAAWCWGLNGSSQLGFPGRNCLSPPGSCLPDPELCFVTFTGTRNLYSSCYSRAMRVDTEERFVAISAGVNHTCALRDDGRAFCWGAFSGVGNNTNTGAARPVAVFGELRFKAIDAGEDYTCALTTDGTAYCWGRNEAGQLGDGTLTERFAPVAVAGGRSYTDISANMAAPDLPNPLYAKSLWQSTTCATTVTLETWCWGFGKFGELGDGNSTTVPRTIPARVNVAPARAVSVGGTVACVVITDALQCWGTGRVGDGSENGLRAPVVVGATREFVDVAAGQYHACALTQLGAVYCWGHDLYGELGRGAPVYGPNKPFLLVPVRVPDVQ
jgi:alpha-tubulin suppressor-like RCC1 family protein